ncbi:5-formyltetrahydrofolate cyclo-ligase [Thermodesulfovibrio thiophilus]|uniref:5-formyltetrahydrofolate cyclo-ligase n=1 Tax=Thermodesulfovibrio thiophilus TaxID=340095 RepID=UPI0004038F4F|nr:5-formyltetrahydrofolate cyclo-ligase [Thermodesulfovibrio thiophilus]
MTKQEIRSRMLERRKNIDEQIKKQKNLKIASSFIHFLETNSIKSILLYASFGSEVDTWMIFQYCINKSIKTAFPKVNKKSNRLELFWVDKIEELTPGYKLILEPSTSKRALIENIDVIAVPGVAFDKQCFRIGYGGGFYDRLLLHKKGFAIGLAYEEQIVDKLPVLAHDKRVDLIITDERVISCV